MRPTTTLTPSDLPRTVRGVSWRPLVSVAVVTQLLTCQGCVPRQGDAVVVATGLMPPAPDQRGDA
jgi:hypothetical protein